MLKYRQNYCAFLNIMDRPRGHPHASVCLPFICASFHLSHSLFRLSPVLGASRLAYLGKKSLHQIISWISIKFAGITWCSLTSLSAH